MAVVKLAKGKYINGDAIKKVIKYAFNPKKTSHNIYGCLGVVCSNTPLEINASLIDIQQEFRNEKGRKVYHFIVAFSKMEQLYLLFEDYLRVGYKIIEFFDDRDFQACFVLHETKDKFHFHIIVNSVNYRTGKKFRYTKKRKYKLKKKVEDIINAYLPPKYQTHFF